MIEMKNRLKDIKRYLWDVLLFSGIGCFSYFLLVYYADIPSQYQDRLMTFQAFSAVVVLFNGVGLSVKYINEKLIMYYQFFLNLKSASNLNGNLNCSKELEHYSS